MNTRSLKLGWLQLGGVGAVFMSIFLSTYVLKIHVNADNVANGQYLATLVEENPIYHQINYHEYDVQERMNEQELIDYGQMIYANRQEPTVIRLKQPQAITTKDAISVGNVEEVDFYIAKKQAALWYILHFPLHATIKENLSEVFDLDTDIQVDLKNLVVYAKVKVLNGATPEKFMSYLPTLHEQILNNVENNQEIKQVKIELVTNEDRYVYDRQNQNQLIHIKTLKNEEKNGKD